MAIQPDAAFIRLDNKGVWSVRQLLLELDRLDANGVVHGIDRSRFMMKANSFTTCSGFEPGRGYVLLLGSVVTEIMRTQSTGSAQGPIDKNNHELVFELGNTVIRFKKLTITTIQSITGGNGDKKDALYLCELADLRVLFPLTSINKAYNLRAPDDSVYADSLLAGVVEHTYESMIDDIWSRMPPIFGTLDKSYARLPAFADAQPVNYAFRGITAGAALEKVLDDLNHTLTLSREGTFSVESNFTHNQDFTDDLEVAREFLFVDSDSKSSNSHKVPESVDVYFPSHNHAWQSLFDSSALSPNDTFTDSPLYNVRVPTGIDGAVAGTAIPVHDPTPAIFDETGNITNNAVLAARAATLAAQYTSAITLSDYEFYYSFSSLCHFEVGIEVDTICYCDFGGGLFTTIRGNYRSRSSSPLLDKHRTAGDSLDDSAPSHLAYSTKELNAPPVVRNTMTPDRFAIVQPETIILPNQSGMAKVLFGTNSSATQITMSATGLPHRVRIFDIVGSSYNPSQILFAWENRQTGRWVILSALTQLGFRFRNDDPDDAPPHAVLFIVDEDEDATGPFYIVHKPDTEFDTIYGVSLVPDTVGSGDFGFGSFLTEGGTVAITGGGDAEFGGGWGPSPGEWTIAPFRLGFTLTSSLRRTINGQECISAIQSETKTIIAKMTSTIDNHRESSDTGTGQKSGTAKIYFLIGTDHEREEAGYEEITVYDFMMNKDDKIETDTWVVVTPYGQRFGEFVIVNAYCGKDDTGTPSSQLGAGMLADSSPLPPPPKSSYTAVGSTTGSVGPLV